MNLKRNLILFTALCILLTVGLTSVQAYPNTQGTADGMGFIEPPWFSNDPSSSGITINSNGEVSGSGPDGMGFIEPPWFSTDPTVYTLELKKPGANVTASQKPVTFSWTYDTVGDITHSYVTFEVVVSLDANGKTGEFTIYTDSDSCSNGVCTYQANDEFGSFTKADVIWYVTAYWGGGSQDESFSSGTQIFKINFAKPDSGKPAAPVLRDPFGTVSSRTVGFYWLPSKNAEYYDLTWWNDRGESQTIRQTQNDSTCQKNLCIVKTTLPREGNYKWTVTAFNNKGTAASETAEFRIAVSKLRTPVAYLPNTTISDQNYVSFQWEDIQSGVTMYRIQVAGKYSNTIEADRWYDTGSIYISGGRCYVMTNLRLSSGYYSWRVMGRNGTSESEWSSWTDFSVNCDNCGYDYNNANTIATPVYPTGTISDPAPTYQWKAVTGASYYQLKVYSASGANVLDVTVPSAGNCASGSCTYSAASVLPENGTYSWSVTTYGSNGGYWGYTTSSFSLAGSAQTGSVVFIVPGYGEYLNPENSQIIWTDPGESVEYFELSIQDSTNLPLFTANLTRADAWCNGIVCSVQFRTIPSGTGYHLSLTPYFAYNRPGTAADLVFSCR